MEISTERLISIIIPVYNVKDYLEDTLYSIINQTFDLRNIEVILIDDASTDGSDKIIKTFVNEYDNFKGIFFKRGSGFPGKPRNVGLNYVSSDYVMFLDSDDFLDPNACEILYNKIIATGADIVVGGYTHYNSDLDREVNLNVWINTLTDPYDSNHEREKQVKNLLNNPNFELTVTDLREYESVIANYNVWGKIFKKSLFSDNNIIFPENIVAQDSVFLLHCFFCAKKIIFIGDIIVHYNNMRFNKNDISISHILSKTNLEGRLSAYFLMYGLSKQYGYVDLFAKYILFQKINYWFNHYLIKTNISDIELSNIFKKYNILFKLCIDYKMNMSEFKYDIFKDISECKFTDAISKINTLK